MKSVVANTRGKFDVSVYHQGYQDGVNGVTQKHEGEDYIQGYVDGSSERENAKECAESDFQYRADGELGRI